MKILINTPCFFELGGVANHYKGLRPYWSEIVHYNFIAGRKSIPRPLLLPFDLVLFFFKLLFGGYDIVLLNAAVAKTALKCGALVLKVSWVDIKRIVFCLGWGDELARETQNKPAWFIYNYNEVDTLTVPQNGE